MRALEVYLLGTSTLNGKLFPGSPDAQFKRFRDGLIAILMEHSGELSQMETDILNNLLEAGMGFR